MNYEAKTNMIYIMYIWIVCIYFLFCWYILCYGAASFKLLFEGFFCSCSWSMVHRATVAILLSWWTVSALLSSLLLYLAGYSTRLLHLLQQPSCFWDLVMQWLVWRSGKLFLSVSDISSWRFPVILALQFLISAPSSSWTSGIVSWWCQLGSAALDGGS